MEDLNYAPDDETAEDNGDHVVIVPEHEGDEVDDPRSAEDMDDDLSDVPEGDVVDESELN